MEVLLDVAGFARFTFFYHQSRLQAPNPRASLKAAVMLSLRMVCKVRSRKRYNSYRGEQCSVAPKLLKRQFEADAPNQKWVTDVTEFSVGDWKLYL